ncbi:MAG TPA: LuxR C-terminal-related transcriptional regulator, partial [Solirubrobacteraceae bacterium]
LPEETQRLLLLAAAEPTGDPVLLWRAARLLGIAGSVLGPAEEGGLIEVGTRVRFRHPIVRSAVYRAASTEERREVNRALAEATDADTDPDRRAWHLAEATSGPDEEVAAELERAANRAQGRGGLAAAAAFLERATVLTVEPSLRAERALAAAQTKVQAGALDAVPSLLAAAEAEPLDELQQGRADLVRAQLAFVTSRGSDGPVLLVNAAQRLESIAPDLARATYVDAVEAATFAGRFAAPGGTLPEVSLAASAAPPRAPRAGDLLLDGLAANFSKGYVAGFPILRRALGAFGDSMAADQHVRGMAQAFTVAVHLWDDDSWEVLSDRSATLCREAGALSDLPIALNALALIRVLAGDMTGAASLVDEVQAATEATGINFGPYGAMGLAAFRGNETEASALTEASISAASLRGEGSRLAAAQWANAVLNNGLGRYQQALGAAQRASECRSELMFNNWALSELIEAAARIRIGEAAAGAYRWLCEMTGASGTDWALGVEARCRALLSDGEAADGLYREAIERLGRTRIRVELARAHLLYGEWLRRERRRIEAREQLRTAHEMLSMMGVHAFAGRAERELLATGEHVRKPAVVKGEELTPQEVHIARLARDGVSNPEIAARLFISRRTVEYHLGKVFTKLNIRSRHELDRALPAQLTAPLAS